MAGVEAAILDLGTKRTTVIYDLATIDRATIVETLADAGYPPEAVTTTREDGRTGP